MFTRGPGLRRASKKTVMTRIAFQNWRHRKKNKKKDYHHRCSSAVSDAAAAKGNLLSLFTACECVEPLLYIMSALIHGPALGASAQGSEFPRKKKKIMETRGGDGEWAGGDTDKYENGGRRKEGGEGLWESDVGSHPFFSPPRTLSHYSSRYYPPSLACVSAALSDATLQSESAIATSRACSVSRALTLASSPFSRGVVVAAVRGRRSGGVVLSRRGGIITPSL